MWVVCQQRAVSGCSLCTNGPSIAGRRWRRSCHWRLLRSPEAVVNGAIVETGRDMEGLRRVLAGKRLGRPSSFRSDSRHGLAAEPFALPVRCLPERHVLRKRQAVNGRPWGRASTQHRELQGPSSGAAATFRDPGVDAGAIGLESLLSLRLKVVVFGQCRAAKSEPPQETVGIEHRRPNQFSQRTGGYSPADLHLPEAILCGGVALAKEEIAGAGGEDVGDGPAITDNLDLAINTAHSHCAPVAGQRPPQPIPGGASHSRAAEERTKEPFHHVAPDPVRLW